MSTEDNREEKPPKWYDVCAFIMMRFVDAGLTPWLLVALFLLGLTWVVTRNLNSQDTLAFLKGFISLQGFAWFGWILAFAQIPIARWAINRVKKSKVEQLRRLEEETDKTRELLKKHKQGVLELKE